MASETKQISLDLILTAYCIRVFVGFDRIEISRAAIFFVALDDYVVKFPQLNLLVRLLLILWQYWLLIFMVRRDRETTGGDSFNFGASRSGWRFLHIPDENHFIWTGSTWSSSLVHVSHLRVGVSRMHNDSACRSSSRTFICIRQIKCGPSHATSSLVFFFMT